MRLAICAQENHEDSLVANRFARANYFLIYDYDTMNISFIENTAKNEQSGAGGQATRLLADLDIDIFLVPKLGPKALKAIESFDIIAYEYKPNTTVKVALYSYFEKTLQEVKTATGKKN